jgi:hypothetical protein
MEGTGQKTLASVSWLHLSRSVSPSHAATQVKFACHHPMSLYLHRSLPDFAHRGKEGSGKAIARTR